MIVLDQAQMLEATQLTRAGRFDGGRFAPAGRTARRRGRKRYSTGSSAARLTPPIIEGEISCRYRAGCPCAQPHRLLDRRPQAPHAPGLENQSYLRLRRARDLKPADVAPSAGGYISGSFSNAVGSRSYKLYIPSHYSDGPAP